VRRAPGCADKSVADIVKQQCSFTDGCTMSGANIGGLERSTRGNKEARNRVVFFEGLHASVGLAGRDPKTGERHVPKRTLGRLPFPRRVHTQAHGVRTCASSRPASSASNVG
jgi:tryptophanase